MFSVRSGQNFNEPNKIIFGLRPKAPRNKNKMTMAEKYSGFIFQCTQINGNEFEKNKNIKPNI